MNNLLIHQIYLDFVRIHGDLNQLSRCRWSSCPFKSRLSACQYTNL